MLNRIAPVIVTGIFFTIAAGPVFARPPDPVAVPEPTTMTLFGLGVGGAFIAKKLFARK